MKQQEVDRDLDRLAKGAQQGVERASDIGSSLAEKGNELLARRNQWLDSTGAQVREHPFAAIGIALAAGYVLSLIIRASR